MTTKLNHIDIFDIRQISKTTAAIKTRFSWSWFKSMGLDHHSFLENGDADLCIC